MMKTRIELIEEKRKKFRKQILVFVGILICIACIFWIYNSFRLETVSMEGLTRYTEEEFRKRLESNFLMTMTPIFAISDRIEQKEIPFIETYEIFYVNEHTARVIVHEKRITGCVLIMGRYMYFDKDGTVVESSSEVLEGIPCIKGLRFDTLTLYQPLNVANEDVFDILLSMTQMMKKYELKPDGITLQKDGEEIVLTFANVRINLGAGDNMDEKAARIKSLLPDLADKSGTLHMEEYTNESTNISFIKDK